jgi:CRISPR-associated protein Cmr5
MRTRSQKLAQAAYPRVSSRYEGAQALDEKKQKEYRTFAKKFPALIHTCGLAQAVAFARAKGESGYIDDLTAVLRAANHAEITDQQPLDHHARTAGLSTYLRLSRDAIEAASWLKRYVEAVAGEEE